jgi:tetratricopeptide (TPR) repeat protein
MNGQDESTRAKELLTVVLDPNRPDSERVTAATKTMSAANSPGFPVAKEAKTIVEAVASRVIDQLAPTYDAQPLRAQWREFNFAQPNSLSAAHCLVVAKLLYERGEYEAAERYFVQHRNSCDASALAVLLSAYNLEQLGRQRIDDAPLLEAESLLLREQDFLRRAGATGLEAERLHALGHVYAARACVSGGDTESFADRAIEKLGVAASMNAAYTSCYTSCFSELGDFVRTVTASFEAMSGSKLAKSLEVKDAVTVLLEIIFYLGHALSGIGEHERALLCFDAFARRTSAEGLSEPRDHARLFRIKTELKRRRLTELSEHELESFYDELGELSFRARSSLTVSDEKRRYEVVVQFLAQLVRYQASMGGPELDRAAVAARAVVDRLLSERPGIADAPAMTILYERALAPFAIEIVSSMTPAVEVIAVEALATSEVELGDVVAAIADEDAVEQVLSAFARERPVTLLNTGVAPTGAKSRPYLVVDSEIEFRRVVELSVALVLARRFLADDDYVYALVPCTESPALRYQQPTYSVAELLPGAAI